VNTVVVAGALANKAGSGGEAWVRLSWIRGFQQLGIDTWFVEELAGAVDGDRVSYFREVMARFGLAERATLLVDGDVAVGPSLADLAAVAGSAALVNISGNLRHPRLLSHFRTRAFVDIDPGFTQAWHAAGDPAARVDGHELHFTIGEAIGTPSCPIPTTGIRWRPTRQPVVLDDWPAAPLARRGEGFRFTTVGTWRGPYGPVTIGGRTYGLKVHEFRKLIELPRRVPSARFELALAFHPDDGADVDALLEHGWTVVAPDTAASPDGFRDYVQSSDAELSVAQGVYVGTASGWFSDRTVRYLASGRPAVVQDTGFSRFLPTGEGLLAFHALEDAAAGAARVVADPELHAAAARRIAEEHFAAERVLPQVCEQLGL
jgi:hypothetical protein